MGLLEVSYKWLWNNRGEYVLWNVRVILGMKMSIWIGRLIITIDPYSCLYKLDKLASVTVDRD